MTCGTNLPCCGTSCDLEYQYQCHQNVPQPVCTRGRSCGTSSCHRLFLGYSSRPLSQLWNLSVQPPNPHGAGEPLEPLSWLEMGYAAGVRLVPQELLLGSYPHGFKRTLLLAGWILSSVMLFVPRRSSASLFRRWKLRKAAS
eukprot:3813923-Amphidinium_carterae.1